MFLKIYRTREESQCLIVNYYIPLLSFLALFSLWFLVLVLEIWVQHFYYTSFVLSPKPVMDQPFSPLQPLYGLGNQPQPLQHLINQWNKKELYASSSHNHPKELDVYKNYYLQNISSNWKPYFCILHNALKLSRQFLCCNQYSFPPCCGELEMGYGSGRRWDMNKALKSICMWSYICLLLETIS